MPVRTFAVVLIILGAVAPAHAQRWHASADREHERQLSHPLDDMAHMSWTRRDGAPSDIAALAQTSDGYLWIGSRLGLFRFDGLQFASYPFQLTDPQLPSSDIAALASDGDGGLWIGFRMGGITHLKKGGAKVDYSGESGLISESTEQLLCREDGSVWATADGRLMHLNGSVWENYSATHGLASEGLYSLFFDRGGNLWTADEGHLYELQPGADKFVTVVFAGKKANQFVQLPNGDIWVSDAWTSVRPLSDRKEPKAVRIPGVPVLLTDNDGRIWLAHDFAGLTRIQSPGTANQRVENYAAADGLSDGQTRAILKDQEGAIWVGTARGLDRFKQSSLTPFRGVLLDYFPALVADPKNGIWLTDMDKPLMHLHDGRLSFIGKPHGSSSLYQDDKGGIWLIDPISHEFFRYPDDGGAPLRIPVPDIARQVETWCIGTDIHGALLASFEGHGLWRYSNKWEQVVAPGLPKEAPLSLMKDPSGRLWLGYPHNQIVLQDAAGLHVFDRRQGVDLNAILTFYNSSTLIVGGSDGLAYFDGRNFHSLQLRTHGLLRGISGIVTDRWGDLWLNGASGVIRIPASEWAAALKNSSYLMDFQILNERDGLFGTPAQSKPTPSAIVDKKGILWFATSGHLVSIDPGAAKRIETAPNVLLQSIFVNGSVVNYANGMSVTADSHNLKNVEFDYIGVALNAPDRVVYQYKLEGQDKEWLDAGTRKQAYYTNLGPGHYHFLVRAASGTGSWRELPASVPFTVTPAFYQTNWFYAACAALLLGLLWLAYRVRVRNLTAHMQQQMEARAHERVRIARDLHDTLLQGVQGLVLRFHFATEQLRPDEPVREMLRKALVSADQVINEGREKVRELREPVSSKDLVEHLEKVVTDLQGSSKARISLLVEGTIRRLNTAVQEELSSIAREAVNNALRHSGANSIELRIVFEAKQLRFSCLDDGSGMSAEVLQTGFRQGHWGILGMRERADRLGGKLELRSGSRAGTEVEVNISAKVAYTDRKEAISKGKHPTIFESPGSHEHVDKNESAMRP